ncbi:MAG: alpha/beta hydrolase [Bryobacterales bacterium]|nr:alpha/beta hydrolase [Bryobacterales bacterium]
MRSIQILALAHSGRNDSFLGLVLVRVALVGLALALLSACGHEAGQSANPSPLADCEPGEGPRNALCGWIPVYEDRSAESGRQIDLRVVVYPALSRDREPDPLFVLAGGPGQGAAEIGSLLVSVFGDVRQERDIVFVDQRGTGRSNGLPCDRDTDDLDAFLSDDHAVETFLNCLDEIEADLRFYTTPLAMDDLDEVRAVLGYERINLWGGSYGTRAALVYLRRHGERVRSIVFDGAVPMTMTLPEGFPQDSQRALDLLLDDCELRPACRGRFPDLRRNLDEVLASLGRDGKQFLLRHPRTGANVEVRLRAEVVTDTLRLALYSPEAAALVPKLIEQMHGGDFAGLLALAVGAESSPRETKISWGMFFSVICAEDIPWIGEEVRNAPPAGVFSNDETFEAWDKICAAWPRGEVGPEYHEPVVSGVPALVLSGALDPVTPPRRGEALAAGFSSALHVVVPGTGHGATARGCVPELVAKFVQAGSVDDLDTSCVDELKRPGFFVTLGGPAMEREP